MVATLVRLTRFELARAPGSHPSQPTGFQVRSVFQFRHNRSAVAQVRRREPFLEGVSLYGGLVSLSK